MQKTGKARAIGAFITEMFEGISGAYKSFSYLRGTAIPIRIIFVFTLCVVTMVQRLTTSGLWIGLPVPWSPGYISVTIPASWFNFLIK